MKKKLSIEQVEALEKLTTTISKHKEDIEEIYEVLVNAKLDVILSDYQKTKSPLFLWDALSHCITENLLFPNVVKDFFQNCTSNLTSLGIGDEKTRYRDICENLSLKGGSTFNAYYNQKRKRIYVSTYYCILIATLIQNEIPTRIYDRNRLKVSCRQEVSTYLDNIIIEDRTARNWINEFNIHRKDLLSFFIEEEYKTLSKIPAFLPLFIYQEFDFVKTIFEKF